MKLSGIERERLRAKYDGRCAYCGQALSSRWHADHFEAVVRELRSVVDAKGTLRTRATARMQRSEHDTLGNLMPSCVPCNMDKSSMPLEAWRTKLSRTCEVLARNNPTYRHGIRFGLITETTRPVVFHFEVIGAKDRHATDPTEHHPESS